MKFLFFVVVPLLCVAAAAIIGHEYGERFGFNEGVKVGAELALEELKKEEYSAIEGCEYAAFVIQEELRVCRYYLVKCREDCTQYCGEIE